MYNESNEIFEKSKNVIFPNFLCKKCNKMPLLGLEYLNNNLDEFNLIQIYQYCLNKHEKNEKKFIKCSNFDEVFSIQEQNPKDNKNIYENNKEYNHSYSKKNSFEKFGLPKKKLNEIKLNLEKSTKNLKNNLSLIEEKIEEVKKKLEQLIKIYNEYKEINEKLKIISQLIIDNYENNLISKNIEYPNYFNLFNLLEFNFENLNINKDLSINEYIFELKEKIKSGYFYILKESKYSRDLDKYDNDNINNSNKIYLSKFEIISSELKSKIILDEERIIGFNNKVGTVEIFNIKNKMIETKIPLNIESEEEEDVFIKKHKNYLIFKSNKKIDIINSLSLELLQTITIEKAKKYDNEENFSSANFLENGDLAVTFEGNINLLNEDISNKIDLNKNLIINGEDYYTTILEKIKELTFLLIFKQYNHKFIVDKILILIKHLIKPDEVSYVTGKYCNWEDDGSDYCSFHIKSFHQISKNQILYSFESILELDRDQSTFYFTDTQYNNEFVYYLVDLSKNESKKCFSYPYPLIVKNIPFQNLKINLVEDNKKKIFYCPYTNDENYKFKIKNNEVIDLFKDQELNEKIKIIQLDKRLSPDSIIFGYDDILIVFGENNIFIYRINSNNQLFFISETKITEKIKSDDNIIVFINPNKIIN